MILVRRRSQRASRARLARKRPTNGIFFAFPWMHSAARRTEHPTRKRTKKRKRGILCKQNLKLHGGRHWRSLLRCAGPKPGRVCACNALAACSNHLAPTNEVEGKKFHRHSRFWNATAQSVSSHKIHDLQRGRRPISHGGAERTPHSIPRCNL